ncbi:hypothetical protein [Cypionkella sp.]|uniref:hypothetical protein n=1 Tax=Cypionkella sp. TaxID=2811411 RepID=UPI00260547AC|nr:hypothetical protein [Cypionkella sp.]
MDEAVLDRFAGHDVLPFDLLLGAPHQTCFDVSSVPLLVNIFDCIIKRQEDMMGPIDPAAISWQRPLVFFLPIRIGQAASTTLIAEMRSLAPPPANKVQLRRASYRGTEQVEP